MFNLQRVVSYVQTRQKGPSRMVVTGVLLVVVRVRAGAIGWPLVDSLLTTLALGTAQTQTQAS
jgi:hypothetical protein